jgi:predicted TIM-barrel fold metal-dependent hydrolase
MRWHLLSSLTAFSLMASTFALAEPPSDIRELKLKDWAPRSMMATKTTKVDKPMFPVIDDHNHLGTGKAFLTPQRVAHYLAEMDAAGVRTVVNLDGMWGQALKETLDALDNAHPGRFLTFAQINFDGIDDADWSEREAKRLEESFKAGAKGLKFHKSLGLGVRHKDGTLMKVDDPKMDPIMAVCAKYNKPIMIHTADPSAFFTPLNQFNERWHELNEHPDWLFYGGDYPTQKELLDQLMRLVARNPKTTFIGAHFGCYAENVAQVAEWLDKYPNFTIDIDARISELGRQPYTTRKFLIKYQDRVMFGTDTTCNRESYRVYYRFLETDDEYFDCAASHHLQGFWMIYGVFLPKDVLEKLYNKNAERIFSLGAKPAAESSSAGPRVLKVPPTDDFELTGDGSARAWQKAAWEPLSQRSGDNSAFLSRFKMLYSPKGLYVLMNGADRKLSATIEQDFADLWNEDAFEFFLWPDQRQTVYFEYEISPLGHELPILIPNVDGQHMGWRPWHYEGARKTRKATSVLGGEAKPGADISGWTAEVFVPYALLEPLGNVPPRPQTRWRANFYRVDYDGGRPTGWAWSRVGPSFHDYKNYGTLEFE